MEGDFIKINDWLRPLSWLYGLGVSARNMMFDIGLLKSRSFDVPVVSVGNITVGGTGKTPHVEYLVGLLAERFGVAVLSRGYKRKTHGFVVADSDATAATVGDEPCQMKHKFPKATVAVDKNRCRGISLLTKGEMGKSVDVIILDDAFQHRYVKPGVNILLVDYHRLIIYDTLLPAGRMREPLSGKNRADIVIVTKCPAELKPMDFRVITKAMGLYPYQHLYFTTLAYESLHGVFTDDEKTLGSIADGTQVLLITGIASPRQMIDDLRAYTQNIHPLTFGDHHAFTAHDVKRINSAFAELDGDKIVVTTEKDAERLRGLEGLDDSVRESLYALPVRIKFMLGQGEMFNENIIGYVLKNSRNSILAKAKDDNMSQDGDNTGNRPRTISFRNH